MSNIQSHHTFMLPFIFEGAFNTLQQWKYKPFKITSAGDYNEINYFYPHVQEALFNTKEEEDGTSISSYYEYVDQKGIYEIETSDITYRLDIEKISLRIFGGGIAILSFDLSNHIYADPEDILRINDLGRRIYPPFLDNKTMTKETKKSVLAQRITLNLEGKEPIKDDFSYYDTIENLQSKMVRLPAFIAVLLEAHFKGSLRPAIDDRMFVLSSYFNDDISKRLSAYDEEKDCYIYEEDVWWYRYLFVDGGDKTCQSVHMSRTLIRESSYDRWVEYGTLYGVSRYSFVLLSDTDFGRDKILPHMQTLYFQMFSLLLAYRASILKFSDKIQEVTQENRKSISERSQALYGEYLGFLNKLYFKEVTAQDQGIEIYQQAMQVMHTEDYMKDLDNEINELHRYVQMIESENENRKLNTLNKLAGLLLPVSVLSGLAGMNILPKSWTEAAGEDNIYILGFTFVSVIITWLIYRMVNIKEER